MKAPWKTRNRRWWVPYPTHDQEQKCQQKGRQTQLSLLSLFCSAFSISVTETTIHPVVHIRKYLWYVLPATPIIPLWILFYKYSSTPPLLFSFSMVKVKSAKFQKCRENMVFPSLNPKSHKPEVTIAYHFLYIVPENISARTAF